MRRILTFMGEKPSRSPANRRVSGARADLRKSSASLRRLYSTHYINNGTVDARVAAATNPTFRWGWSRAERERLVRMQAVVRGWLVRRRVCWIPARDLQAVLHDVDQRDKGLRRFVAYVCYFLLFFSVLILESDVTFQHSVETGIKDFINQVASGPDGDVRLSDVSDREEFSSWTLALFLAMYDGTEQEDVCNTCAAIRGASASLFFPEIDEGLWGTEVPSTSSRGAGSQSSGSFIFEVDSCPLCYGSDRASIVGEAGSIGEEFCGICSGLEPCFADQCLGFDEITPVLAEVKGTNASFVKVHSNEDCFSDEIFSTTFPRDFWIRVGVTSVAAIAPFADQEEIQLQPTGRGYMANKNKVIGALLLDWTYYKSGDCQASDSPSFYGPCYKDEGSHEDLLEAIQKSQTNPLVTVDVREGRWGEGLVYSVTTDTGVFNTGLNLNLCGLLAIVGGQDIITDAVRTISIRFNTYNGQMDGLFSSVDITAHFSLGGEVQILTDVQVFSMPDFFGSDGSIICRAAAMFAFALMLARYIAHDLRRVHKEVKDGQHRVSMSVGKIPISAATALKLIGDVVFLLNLYLWINTAVTASLFTLTPTLAYNNASEQVTAFGEDLALVALERWKRDAAAVAGGMFGLARLFIMLRFHPRLSLVTDVLTASAVHLAHFFIMFFMVVGVYTNLAWVIFGPSSELFATWSGSFVTMTRIALGEFDDLYPRMVAINDTAAFIIIVTYQTLQGILLLNIVISILLDGFQVVHERNSAIAADTLRETVMTTVGRWRIHLLGAACSFLCRRPYLGPQVSPWDDSNGTSVHNAVHDKAGSPSRERRTASSQSTLSTPPGLSPSGGGGITPNGTPGAPVTPRGTPADSVSSPIALLHLATGTVGSTKWKVDINGSSATKGGLTRGQRLALSHRHYDIRAAVEILRRSPLPESAVWRKMRQIVGGRLGQGTTSSGNRVKPLQPGSAWKK